MPTETIINIENLSINVLIAGESNKAILFVHGNSSDAHIWDGQLQSEQLGYDYKLIAFDLPGHGKSSKSDDYSMKKLAGLIPLIVKELGVKEYVLVGMSFGTCLIGEAAPHLPGCRGIMAISANLTSNEYHPGIWLNPFPEVPAMASAAVPDEILESFANRLVVNDSAIARQYADSYKNTDPQFRLAIGEIIAKSTWTDEPGNILQMNVPVCIVFGKEEKVLHTNYLDNFSKRWHDKTYLIPAAAHFINAEQPELFNELLLEFAGDVLK